MQEEVILWIGLGILLALVYQYASKYTPNLSFNTHRMFFKKKSKKGRKKSQKKKEKNEEEDSDDWIDDKGVQDSSDEDEKFPDGAKIIRDDIMNVRYPAEDIKMVLVVREDLKMTKGKIGAQCGHATLGAYKACQLYGKESDYWRDIMNKWSWDGQKKICLKVNNESEMYCYQPY